MHLAEDGRVVAIEPEYLSNRGGTVGPRCVAWKARGDFGDGCHVDGMMIASSQHGLARGRAERGRMKPRIRQPFLREPFGNGHVAGPAVSTGCAEAHIVDQDDQDVGAPCGARNG